MFGGSGDFAFRGSGLRGQDSGLGWGGFQTWLPEARGSGNVASCMNHG